MSPPDPVASVHSGGSLAREATGVERTATGRRDGELSQLAAVLERLPTAQVVDVHGEPGIGKTRLLDEFAALARARGVEPLVGRGTEYERSVPFSVFAEPFTRLAVGRPGSPELGADAVAALGVVTATAGATPGTSGPERYRLYRTLRLLLTAPARPPGTVLILDDLHWADEASLELLEHLLHEPHGTLAIAVAYRTGQAPPRLANALARTRTAATRIALAPLLPADVVDLLPEVPPLRRDALYRASGGNPLYLDALGRVDDRTLTSLADPALAGSEHLPHGVQSLLCAELAALDETQRLVTHTLAVAGDPAYLDVVVHVADRSEPEVSRTIDGLVTLGIVRCAGSRFSFRHPLVRAAAYQSAGPAWRIGAHRRAERYLARHGGPLPVRAHHAARAASYGDRAAVATLVEAATASLDSTPATAADWLRAALRILPDDPPEDRVGLLVLLARALGLAGELAESRDILHQILGLSSARRGMAVRFCAVTERLLGRLDESRALLEAELAEPRRLTSDDIGRLEVELAAVHVLRNESADCARTALSVVERGRRDRDAGQQAAGQTLAGVAALHLGDVATARCRLAEASALVDGLTDAQLREHLHLLSPLAWLELNLERYPDGLRHLARGGDIARASGRSHVLPYLLILSSALEARVGRLDRARQCSADATEMSRFIGSAETLAMARAVELRTALWQRGPAPTLALIERFLHDGRPKSEWWAELADVVIATVQLMARQPAACVEYIADRCGPRLAGVTALSRPQLWGSLAMAKARLGAHQEAAELAGKSLAAADALGLPFQQGLAQQAHSRVLLPADPASAIEQARSAMRSFAEAGAPLYVALAREAVAHGLAAAGDRAGARVELGRAKSGYAAASAHWLSLQATHSEARLGAQASRGAGTGVLGALSTRELEVAQLAATGLTNREIAQQLFLSPKTVEAHLGRVFTKLDVRSRVGVAQLFAAPPT